MTGSGSPRIDAVMAAIRHRVARRTLGPGEKLPSIRRFAEAMSVSPSTVVEAYDRLAAEGLISARPGSGFYVSAPDASDPGRGRAAGGTGHRSALGLAPVARTGTEPAQAGLRLAAGRLDAGGFAAAGLAAPLADRRRGPDPLRPGAGLAGAASPSRPAMGRRRARCRPGPNPADLLGKPGRRPDLPLLLRPGDTVLLDDPGYFNFQALLRAHRVKAGGRSLHAERPRSRAVRRRARGPSPAPLPHEIGAPQSDRRHAVAADRPGSSTLAAASDLAIVEDDIFADFEPEPSPRLAVLDGLDRVIRIGSFSKTLSASVRCGYIAARPDWIEGSSTCRSPRASAARARSPPDSWPGRWATAAIANTRGDAAPPLPGPSRRRRRPRSAWASGPG